MPRVKTRKKYNTNQTGKILRFCHGRGLGNGNPLNLLWLLDGGYRRCDLDREKAIFVLGRNVFLGKVCRDAELALELGVEGRLYAVLVRRLLRLPADDEKVMLALSLGNLDGDLVLVETGCARLRITWFRGRGGIFFQCKPTISFDTPVWPSS